MDVVEALGMLGPLAALAAGGAAQARMDQLAGTARQLGQQLEQTGTEAQGATQITWTSRAAEYFRDGMARQEAAVRRAVEHLELAAQEFTAAGQDLRAQMEAATAALTALAGGVEDAQDSAGLSRYTHSADMDLLHTVRGALGSAGAGIGVVGTGAAGAAAAGTGLTEAGLSGAGLAGAGAAR